MRNHCNNTSSCLRIAAFAQTYLTKGGSRHILGSRRPRECMCFSVLKCPRFVAIHAEFSFISRPVASTASHISVFTVLNYVRSMGSGKFSALRMIFMTSWGRFEIGCCVLNWYASATLLLFASSALLRALLCARLVEVMSSCFTLWLEERDLQRGVSIKSQFPRTLRLELIFAFDRPASHSIPSPLSAVTQATRACAPVRPARHAHAHDRPGDPSGHRGPCVEYIQAETRQDAEGDREDTGCEGTRRRRLREVEVEIDRWRIGVEDHLHGPHNTQRCLHEKTQILVVLPHHRGRAVRPEGA